jgi:hypothetical protein
VILKRNGNLPWGERHPKDTNTENDGRYELQGQWNTPSNLTLAASSTTDVVGPVVYPEGDQNTEGNSKLLKSDQTAAYFWRRKFSAGKLSLDGVMCNVML